MCGGMCGKLIQKTAKDQSLVLISESHWFHDSYLFFSGEFCVSVQSV